MNPSFSSFLSKTWEILCCPLPHHSLCVCLCLSACLCPCLSVSVSPPSPAQLFEGKKPHTGGFPHSTRKRPEVEAAPRLQLWCQQLAWQKCSRPGFQIPVTIMKRLLQTSLSEVSSQEEWGPLILSGAKRIKDGMETDQGAGQDFSRLCLSRASAPLNLPGHPGPVPW